MNTFQKPLTEAEESQYLSVLKNDIKISDFDSVSDINKDNYKASKFDNKPVCSQLDKQEAKRILIERNLRLVAHIAKKYQSSEEDMEDLISVGTIGLIKAIDSYDYDKGSKLVTYAARCIENELLMLLRSKKKSAREVSLYEPLGTDKEGNEISLLDICENEQEEVGSRIELEGDYKKLSDCMRKCLDEREFQIIALRYGFDGYEEMTQKEIGDMLHISRSYVSRIEKRAIQKLRIAYN